MVASGMLCRNSCSSHNGVRLEVEINHRRPVWSKDDLINSRIDCRSAGTQLQPDPSPPKNKTSNDSSEGSPHLTGKRQPSLRQRVDVKLRRQHRKEVPVVPHGVCVDRLQVVVLKTSGRAHKETLGIQRPHGPEGVSQCIPAGSNHKINRFEARRDQHGTELRNRPPQGLPDRKRPRRWRPRTNLKVQSSLKCRDHPFGFGPVARLVVENDQNAFEARHDTIQSRKRSHCDGNPRRQSSRHLCS